jgi:hypothetical protein
MHRLIEKDRRNAERIFAYLGAEEFSTSPDQAHRRFAIDFGQLSEGAAREWPDLMAIVERKVRPQRSANARESYRRWWWQYAEKRVDLYKTIAGLSRVIVSPQTSKYRTFAFTPNGMVYDKQLNVFAFDDPAMFALLQSRPHEVWAVSFGASLEDRPIYTLAGCFEAFPFPDATPEDSTLSSVGAECHDFRAEMMATNMQGLTTTYNRFHDPDESSPEILRLRALHDAVDRAVLDAYGWTDLRPTCEFLLDYEDEDDEGDGSVRARQRKKPWRYRWSDADRDEVQARLLALNQQRR